MKLSDVTIWVQDELLKDKRVVEAIKDFGGIAVYGQNSKEVAKGFDKQKNLYWPDCVQLDAMVYFGEYGTNRIPIPCLTMSQYPPQNIYFDESSPKRIKATLTTICYQLSVDRKLCHYGFSSYRKHFFSIITKKTDWNIRFPFLSPLSTIKKLDTDFIWLCINKNQYFNYPYWSFKDKTIHFKPIPFLRIPFDWHAKGMIKYCEENNKKLFIYAGDENYTADQFLKRINLLKSHFD